MKKTLFVLVCILGLGSGLWGQGYWEKSPDPYGGGTLFSLRKTLNGRIYGINSLRQVIRSLDEGLNWETLPPLPPVDPTESAEVDFSIGFSGAYYKVAMYYINGSAAQYRLFRSTDEGSNWSLLNANLPVYNVIETTNGTLLGNDLNHIYRSTNQGASWQSILDGSYFSWGSLQVAENGFASVYSDSEGYQYSTNNGQTWTSVPMPLIFTAPWRMPGSGTIFVYDLENLLRTDDNGLNWDTVNVNLDYYAQSMMALPSGRLLLTTSFHLYYSDDDGITWSALPDTGMQPGELYPMVLSNGTILGASGSFLRSTDGGATWSFSAWGLHHANVGSMAFLDDSLQLATTSNGLWKTTNAGQNWTLLLTDTTDQYVYPDNDVAYWNADSFIVSTGRRVHRTLNGGQSFTDITPAAGTINYNRLFVDKGSGALFCTTQQGVLRSVDWGASWQMNASGFKLTALVEHPQGDLFALEQEISSNNWFLLRSADHGLNWTTVDLPGIPALYRLGVEIGPGGALYVNGFDNHNMRLATSTDAGASWAYSLIPDINVVNPVHVNALGHLFTLTAEQQILCSVDGGQSWFYISNTLENSDLIKSGSDIFLSPDGRLYASGEYGGLHRSVQSTLFGAYLSGQVNRDADADCSTPDAQNPLPNWVVKAEGATNYTVTTGPGGHYAMFVDTGQYALSVQVPQALWWGVCDSVQTINLNTELATDTTDFAVVALADCPLMSVSLAIPRLRRCFVNPVYVQYCNQGSETADSAWVDIILDPYLSLTQSDQPYENLGDQTYRFYLGDVASGECGQFVFQVLVDCDSTVLGQTHCISAHAFPDTLCTPVPNWSGADVVAGVECQDSVLQFRLHNDGPVPSQSLDYIVIEDDVVLMQGQEIYDAGETLLLDFPANGHTWRIESAQEPGNPFSVRAIAFEEGCGGFASLGQINLFGVDDRRPAFDRICVENTGSYDPNDKQGFPLGLGDDHLIRAGQDLEYLIRFQNTGTDTAFTVVVRDTLSAWLDAASVQPGAASHPYTWALGGDGVLTFTFENILLPDSSLNLAGSQGFVSFRIRQQPQLAGGTEMLNTAQIYFDFNFPVTTNQTRHTIGGYSSLSIVDKPATGAKSAILVSPQPVEQEAILRRADGGEFRDCRFVLYDTWGRSVREAGLNGASYRFERAGLSGGMYYFRVEKRDGKLMGGGSLLLR